jgi:hypothetical protein
MATTTSPWTCPQGHPVTSHYCPHDGSKRPVEASGSDARSVPGAEQIAPNAWQRTDTKSTTQLSPSWDAGPRGAAPSSSPGWGTNPSAWRVPQPKKKSAGLVIGVAVAATVLLAGAVGAIAWGASTGGRSQSA